jgi:exodeoxyribonuclease VII small subunit
MNDSTSKRRRRNSAAAATDASTDPDWLSDVASLSFQEARTALDLAMAQLQASDLEVEEMAGLYRRAEAFANRCEAVLRQVEQEVIEWEANSKAPAP